MTHERHTGGTVRWILNRTHVGTSYEDVAQDIADRLEANNGPDRLLDDPEAVTARARMITDALIQHRRNRADYAWVMGSH